jgi:hypothetical protein
MMDLLLITTPVYTNAPGHSTNYACALARLVGAHVTGWITEIEPDPATGMIEPDLMQVRDEVAEQLSKKECVARTVELVQDAARRAQR